MNERERLVEVASKAIQKVAATRYGQPFPVAVSTDLADAWGEASVDAVLTELGEIWLEKGVVPAIITDRRPLSCEFCGNFVAACDCDHEDGSR